MAATVGTAVLSGLQTGKNYTVDMYLDDVANAPVNWDGGAGAAAVSPEFWTPPENCLLTDVAVVTGAAQTKLQVIVGGRPTGDILRQTLQLNTLAFRPRANILIPAGVSLAMLQLA